MPLKDTLLLSGLKINVLSRTSGKSIQQLENFVSVSSDGLNTDWISSLNDSLSSDPSLSNYGSVDTSSNNTFFDNTSSNFESGLAGLAAQSPGINNFNYNANYPPADSSSASGTNYGGVLSGVSGLLAALGGSGSGGSSSLLNSLLGIGSGIYGMSLGNNLQNMSSAAIAASNPFGPYRSQYAGQLASVEANPSQIFSDPGYQAAFGQGSQAVARQMASSGYAGSGNEAIALQQFGQSFANNYLSQKEQQLAYLAGAGITPNPGPGLSGYNAGANLSGQGLGSLGYGAGMAAAAAGGGSGSGYTPNPMGNFNSAGGEAATIGGDLNTAAAVGNIYDSVTGSNTLSGVGNAAGVYSGIQQGGVTGYGSAAINAGQLAGKTGLYGSDAGTAATGLNDAGAALSVYSGIKQGGVYGDTQAATGAARLATSAGYLGGASGTLARDIPYVGAALGAYQFATQDTKSGATGQDALGGAETGAEVGSAFGPVGTVIGGVVGGVAGAVASAFGPGAMDPENVNWDNYAAAYDSNPQAVNGATPSQNYQALAGIFDSRGTRIPFYNQFGRMGENRFITAMTQQINDALRAGKISSSSSPQQIYSTVVEPWINSMSPSGWQTTYTIKGAPEKGAIGNLLTNLIGEYQAGAYNQWIGVGGQQPFSGLPSFGGGSPVAPPTSLQSFSPNKPGLAYQGAAGRFANV
jgi:hypothetical protein